VILLLDNYDSFTFNLRHALEALGEEVRVERNDEISLDEIERADPAVLVVSPGPGGPEAAGISLDAIARSSGRRPILGVCLGHQAIAVAFGARVRRARVPVHGKSSPIHHGGGGIFEGLPRPFEAARYHSLAVDESSLPADLTVLARSDDGEIMALAHRRLPIAGVQFHPESYLTPDGPALLRNVLRRARAGEPLAA
jgi:anthranilate synthase/aminodeoxychorismate synthase-like glutamine amidotransferase